MRLPVAEGAAAGEWPLCTPLEVLANRIALPHAEVGDLVAVGQSGAYGLSDGVQFGPLSLGISARVPMMQRTCKSLWRSTIA